MNTIKEELLAYRMLTIKEKIEDIYDVAWKAGIRHFKKDLLEKINSKIETLSKDESEDDYAEGYEDALTDMVKMIENL